MTRSILRVLGVLGLLAVLVAIAAGPVAADNLLGGKVRTGDVVTVGSSETISTDLYAFARDVIVNGTVHGDVVAGGGTVTVNGKVDGDVIVAGGTVDVAGSVGGSVIGGGGTLSINGTIGGAIRAGGGRVTIGGSVARDVATGGGTLDVGGTVGGDLLFGAGTTTVTGSVTGSIEGTASSYTRTGTVGGSEHVDVQPASTYQAPVPTFTVTRDPVLDAIRHFVAVVVLGALLLWIVPMFMRRSEEAVRVRPLPSLGWGILVIALAIAAMLAVLIGMIILAIIFAAATLGALVALDVVAGLMAFLVLLFGLIFAAAFLTSAVVGLGSARFVLMRTQPAPTRPMSRLEELGILLVGAAVVVILTSLPIVGPLFELVVVLVGLGAMGIAATAWWRSRGVPTAAPVPASPAATPGMPAA